MLHRTCLPLLVAVVVLATVSAVRAADCSECPDGQYRVSPCSDTDDRVCEACTVCGAEGYFSTCSPRHNAICNSGLASPPTLSCAICNDDEFETQACTATQGRQCQVCKSCIAGYEAKYSNCSGRHDTVCIPRGSLLPVTDFCVTCDPDEYETHPCTTSGGRQCEVCKECFAGYEAHYSNCSARHNTVCIPRGALVPAQEFCETCFADEYESHSCGNISQGGRQCTECKVCDTRFESHFSNCSGHHDTVCVPHGALVPYATFCVTCMSDEYEIAPCTNRSGRLCQVCTQCDIRTEDEVSPCTASADRVCGPKGSGGNTSDPGNITTPVDCSECPAGSYRTSACNETTDRVCTNCTACDSGEYSPCTPRHNAVCNDTLSPDAHTLGCVICADDEFETRACTEESGRICQVCASCAEGQQYKFSNCSGRHDTVCVPLNSQLPPANYCVTCEDDEYETRPCTNTSGRQCEVCHTCFPGYEALYSNCSARHNTVCIPRGSLVPVEEWCVECFEDEYETTPCSNRTGRVCAVCSTCSGDTYAYGNCSGRHDTVCVPSGDNDPEDSCVTCQNGEYEASPCTSTAGRVCKVCTLCNYTQEVETACTATADTVCRDQSTPTVVGTTDDGTDVTYREANVENAASSVSPLFLTLILAIVFRSVVDTAHA